MPRCLNCNRLAKNMKNRGLCKKCYKDKTIRNRFDLAPHYWKSHEIDRVIELFESGWTYDQIAADFGHKNKKRVRMKLQKLGLRKNKYGSINK